MIHLTADISPEAKIGEGTRIWHQTQVREGAQIGHYCIVGKGVYVDKGVRIGDKVKIENYVSLFHGAIIEDGVFLGPYVCLTNDRLPRAILPTGEIKGDADWVEAGVHVMEGASIGAGSIILPGVIIGRFAMVGAGAVVTKSVPDQGLVIGNPARLAGYVCRCGRPLSKRGRLWECVLCGETYEHLEARG